MKGPVAKGSIREYRSAPLSLRWLAVIAFFGCVTANGLANLWGPKSAAKVSDEFKLYVTPPGPFFSIWGMIYTLLTITILYVGVKNVWSEKSHWLFIISNVLNAAWVIVWSFGTRLAVTACFVIIVVLVFALYAWWNSLYSPNDNSLSYYFFRNVAAFYLGWVLAATIINLGIVLVYDLHLPQSKFVGIFWVAVPAITISLTLFNTMRQGVNGLKSSACLWLSVIWGLSGSLITTLINKSGL